jgi:hypothetical protein
VIPGKIRRAERERLEARPLFRDPRAQVFSAWSVPGRCDELERRRERYGISYVTVGDTAADAFAPVVARLAGR